MCHISSISPLYLLTKLFVFLLVADDNELCVRVHISKLVLRNGAVITDLVNEQKLSLSINEAKWLVGKGPQILGALEAGQVQIQCDRPGLEVYITKQRNVMIKKYSMCMETGKNKKVF